MLSFSRPIAAGRGSITLADAMTRNNPNSPSNCHKGIDLVGCFGSREISGVDATTTGVGVAGIGVAVNVTSGILVKVAVGDGIGVTADVAANGIAIIPVSLPHRS